ncbi:MAG: hypothetical protein AAB036_05305 [Elusimicrobiota bacterium]
MRYRLLALILACACAELRAQSFEDRASAAIKPFNVEDVFADVVECQILDQINIRPYSLEEAADLLKPCLNAVARKYASPIMVEAGFLADSQNSRRGGNGLIIKTDFAPGSKAHRDIVSSLTRRDGRLLGHRARVLAKDQTSPAPVSSLQRGLSSCLTITVVRDIRSGEDFIKIYGRCLTQNKDLKIKQLIPGDGLAINVKTDAPAFADYNGLVTVNAGKGPVTIRVTASAP